MVLGAQLLSQLLAAADEESEINFFRRTLVANIVTWDATIQGLQMLDLLSTLTSRVCCSHACGSLGSTTVSAREQGLLSSALAKWSAFMNADADQRAELSVSPGEDGVEKPVTQAEEVGTSDLVNVMDEEEGNNTEDTSQPSLAGAAAASSDAEAEPLGSGVTTTVTGAGEEQASSAGQDVGDANAEGSSEAPNGNATAGSGGEQREDTDAAAQPEETEEKSTPGIQDEYLMVNVRSIPMKRSEITQSLRAHLPPGFYDHLELPEVCWLLEVADARV